MPSTRIVDLPYVYEADCVRPPKRVGVARRVRANAGFAVSVLLSEEAPLATRVVLNDDYERHLREGPQAPGSSPVDRMRAAQNLPPLTRRARTAPDAYETRCWGGDLFEAVGERRGERVALDRFLGDVLLSRGHFHSFVRRGPQGGIERGDLPALPLLEGAGYDRDSPLDYVDLDETLARVARDAGHLGGARVRSHDAAARREEAQTRYARRLAFVGDEAWVSRKWLEPFWAVETVDKDRTVEVHVRWHGEVGNRVSPFRADRLDDALAFAAREAGGLGYEVVRTRDELHVLLPDALRNDDVVMLAVAAASTVRTGDHADGDGWTPALGEALEEIKALKGDGRGPRDLAWAGAVLAAGERAMAAGVAPEDNDLVRALAYPMRRWIGFEKPRRSDVPTPVNDDVDEATLAAGFR